MIVKRKLEDKEREITMKLEDINFNVDKIKGTIQMIGESETLSTALNNLEKRQKSLNAELEAVKDKKGLTIRVSRPCEECNVIDGHKMIPHKINPSEHSSESALDNEGFDYEIINDGTISDLIDKIRIILIENNLINVN